MSCFSSLFLRGFFHFFLNGELYGKAIQPESSAVFLDGVAALAELGVDVFDAGHAPLFAIHVFGPPPGKCFVQGGAAGADVLLVWLGVLIEAIFDELAEVIFFFGEIFDGFED